MTDWLSPKTSDTHANELAAIRGRDESNARMNYDSDLNIPTGTIRWNATAQRFESWSGTAWQVLSAKYMINVDQLDGYSAEDFILSGGSGINADTLDGYNSGNASGCIPISNGVLCVNLNADKVDGYHAGNASNQVAVSNGTLCTNLNADKVDGRDVGHSTGQVPVNDGTVCTSLNADMVDGKHAGNASGQVAVSNGTLCSGLNADMVDGQHGPFLPASGGTLTGGIYITAINGFIEVGAPASANTPLIDFHSSGNSTDYDARIIASGGTTTAGQGTLNIQAGALQFNGQPLGVADGSVSQAKLKTSTGSVSVNVPGNDSATTASLPGGEYAFLPQVKITGLSSGTRMESLRIEAMSTTTYQTPGVKFTRTNTTNEYAAAQVRYVTSSGEQHWIFFMRDKTTKQILQGWQAPDHPCFGLGGDPEEVPHPNFPGYDPKLHEIICVTPDKDTVKAINKKASCRKDFLEVIMEEYDIDEASGPRWPDKEVTVGLPNEVEVDGELMSIHDAPRGTPVTPIKRKIPKPANVVHRVLKRKTK